jgi:hypothetical protein
VPSIQESQCHKPNQARRVSQQMGNPLCICVCTPLLGDLLRDGRLRLVVPREFAEDAVQRWLVMVTVSLHSKQVTGSGWIGRSVW